MWALYKTLTNSKPLKDATRDDGRKLVDYFEKQELKSASIQKKVGWLIAAVNLAIGEGKLKYEETIEDGLENAPRAFIGMLQGRNIGKQLVRVSS